MRSKLTLSVLAVVTAVMIGAPLRADDPAEVAQIGEPAPAFELPDLQGNTHKLEDFAGRIVVLHFQSCRCPWEAAYRPILNALAAQFGPEEVEGEMVQQAQFIAINSNNGEDAELIAEYVEQTPITYPVLKDAGNVVADLYGARATPHIFVIDADGILRYKGGIEKAPISTSECGNSDEQYLEPVLAALVNESELPVTDTMPRGCGIKRQ